MKEKIIIWGGSGNFKVLCELLKDDYEIIGYFDRNINIQSEYNGIPYLGDVNAFIKWIENHEFNGHLSFINSMGSGQGKDRLEMHHYLLSFGLKPIKAIHSTAFVAQNAIIGDGTLIFAKSAVCVDAIIGKCCIINTSSSIDHECKIEDGATIGAGARLAGLVNIGKYADIYTGAIILPKINVGEGAIVGAGAVVLQDVKPYTVVVGNPARFLKIANK